MTCTWEHNRWPQDCEHNGANTKTLRTQCGQYKTGDLHVGSQPMAARCNRRCRLSFYHVGKGASVGERPTRLHFLEATGEKFSPHSTVRLQSLPWIRIAMWSTVSKDCLAWAASSELSNCTASTKTVHQSLRSQSQERVEFLHVEDPACIVANCPACISLTMRVSSERHPLC